MSKVDYAQKENWSKSSLLVTLEHRTVLNENEKASFDRLWEAKQACEKTLGAIISPVADKRISEFMPDIEEHHYVKVDSNYKIPEEGKGENDAVSIFMGVVDANEIDSLISVSTADARRFAQAIINVCDEIDG